MDLFDIAVAKKLAGSGGRDTLVVGLDIETRTLDKTWNEINDAFPNAYVILNLDDSVLKGQIIAVSSNTNDYSIVAYLDHASPEFSTDSADGYPSINAGGSGDPNGPSS